jgi:hypothetical protein
VLVGFTICEGRGCFFFILNSVSISSSSSISICFDLCSWSSFPLHSVITLTFSFGFNAWEGNFPFIWASNFHTLEATCPICFSKLWMLDLVSYWKDMTFCCNVTVLEAKDFIISRRLSLDDSITLEFVNAGGCLAW